MKLAIAGYSGFLGRSFMKEHPGWEYIRLSREVLYGDPLVLGRAMEGVQIVINLSGSPINRRWTARNRRKIHDSRHGVNRNMVTAINGLAHKPEFFISASAIGIYGHEGIHDEYTGRPGTDFMATVVQKWEEPVGWLDGSVQHAILRIGMVLGNGGGSMVPFRKIMKFGIAPVMGSGKQIYSFIHLRDLNESISFIIKKKLNGVFNLCSPNPVDHETFITTLARETNARLKIRIPVWLLSIIMGKAHRLVTEGQHVIPARLLEEDFKFRYPDIGQAMKNLVRES